MAKFDCNRSSSLQLLHGVMVDHVKGAHPDLNQRQLAILLSVYLEAPPHTVRGLSAKLNVTKPVITRALDTMGAMGLVDRKRDERDLRNVVILRTVKGSHYLEELADLVCKQSESLS